MRKSSGKPGSRPAHGGSGQLRIIAGQWRSRRFSFPDGPGLRPTPDRVRETVFNWLAPYVEGARVLDCFAGSGAMLLEAGVQVDVRIPPDLSRIFADPVQLQQVILNLVINAVDALREWPGERRLTLELRQDAADGAVFAVHDSGPGIPPEARDKLFDAFFSTKPDGLGMGLAISRTIVENHGGRLGLDASAAAGARFVFNIPSI